VRAAILIVSTDASRRLTSDETGPLLAALAESGGGDVVAIEVVPDDFALIEDRLRHFVDQGCGLVLTAGGIGPRPEHVTPEATRAVVDRETPGVAEAIRANDPGLLFSRGVAGFAGATLVVNLPGAPDAAQRGFAVLAPLFERD
jgi:molybdenum cofactor synthesis domain-containing protein